MKKVITVVLMSAVFMAQADITLDEVLNDYVEARGGMDTIKGMKTMQASGKMVMMGGQMEAPLEFTYKAPNKIHTTFEIQGMKGIQAYDGSEGWQVMPFMGKPDPSKMSDDELKMFKDQAEDIEGILIDYKKKGHSLELIGATEVEGTPVIEIKATKKNGDVVTVFLDEEFKLEVMTRAKTNMMGQEVETETYFSDYKEVGGTYVAHVMTTKMNGQDFNTITFDEMKYNVDVTDDFFSMPKTKAVSPEPAKAK